MKTARPLGPSSIRAHAFILTRDRTVELGRCIEAAISTMIPGDILTVIDDSSVASARENYELLVAAASRSRACITYLSAQQVCDNFSREARGRNIAWQSRSAPRDIAPLRNLTLLLSAAVNAQTTLLIDDDISCFDVDRTHNLLGALDLRLEGIVVGAKIGGITEQDTITRLTDAMRLIETDSYSRFVTANELFQARPTEEVGECRWVSAGYMAFRLPPNRLFAFPPGYNEDWLWCLLQNTGETTIFKLAQTVVHQPPLLRQSTRDEILFELIGDLIFERLITLSGEEYREPDIILSDVQNGELNPELLPLARVRRVLEQARCLSESGQERLILQLACFGLTTLRELLISRQLDVDWNEVLRNWSRDARVKHQAFAATLKSEAALATLKSIWRDGRL